MSTDWKHTRVADAELTRRLKGALLAHNPDMTLGDLAEMSERDLRSLPNIGKVSEKDAIEALRRAAKGGVIKSNATLLERALEETAE